MKAESSVERAPNRSLKEIAADVFAKAEPRSKSKGLISVIQTARADANANEATENVALPTHRAPPRGRSPAAVPI